MSHRTILHVDMDAFFAAVEERDNPSLKGLPLAVAGAGARTIVTTASYAARARGVRTAMPLASARRLCPELVVVTADFRKYQEASRRILDVLETFTDRVEPFSVDEAFLDGTDLLERFGGGCALGREVKRRVASETGLTASVGVAPNRLLAKLASGMEKPDGLTVIRPEEVAEVLEELPVQELCGVGPRTAEALRALGIRTCGQLGAYPVDRLTRRFGKNGQELSRMGRGEDDSRVRSLAEPEPEARSIGHSVTLDQDTSNQEEMRRILATLAEMVGRRARRQGCSGRKLSVTVRFSDFTTRSRQATSGEPLARTADLHRLACRLLEELGPRQPIRLLGLSLGDLEFGAAQPSLLPEDARRDRLQAAVDLINDRFGEFSAASADLLRHPRGESEGKKRK